MTSGRPLDWCGHLPAVSARISNGRRSILGIQPFAIGCCDLSLFQLTVTTVEYMLPLCVYQSVSSIQRIEVHLIGSSRSDPYLLFNHVNGHELVTSYAATFPNLVEMHVVKHGGFNVKRSVSKFCSSYLLEFIILFVFANCSCRFMMMGVAVLRRFAREVVYTLRVTYRFSNRLSSETTLEVGIQHQKMQMIARYHSLQTATRLARQMKLQYGANAGIIEQVAEQCHRVKLSDSICLQIDNWNVIAIIRIVGIYSNVDYFGRYL